jgi:hypothetical protein
VVRQPVDSVAVTRRANTTARDTDLTQIGIAGFDVVASMSIGEFDVGQRRLPAVASQRNPSYSSS